MKECFVSRDLIQWYLAVKKGTVKYKPLYTFKNEILTRNVIILLFIAIILILIHEYTSIIYTKTLSCSASNSLSPTISEN